MLLFILFIQLKVICFKFDLFLGNYYSLRTEHQKAVLYFQRALRLNPQYLAAWTLMGHEYVELKNTSAAIQSYRQAIGTFHTFLVSFFYFKIVTLTLSH